MEKSAPVLFDRVASVLLVRIPKSSRLEVSLLTHHSPFSIICAGKHISATRTMKLCKQKQDSQRILWLEDNGEWSERSEHCPRSTSQILICRTTCEYLVWIFLEISRLKIQKTRFQFDCVASSKWCQLVSFGSICRNWQCLEWLDMQWCW